MTRWDKRRDEARQKGFFSVYDDAPRPWDKKDKAGETLRDEGAALVDAAVEDTEEGEAWKLRADIVIDELAASGKPFSANDVIVACGPPPRPNAMGARFLAWSKDHRIVPVGDDQATAAASHARRIRMWRGVGS